MFKRNCFADYKKQHMFIIFIKYILFFYYILIVKQEKRLTLIPPPGDTDTF